MIDFKIFDEELSTEKIARMKLSPSINGENLVCTVTHVSDNLSGKSIGYDSIHFDGPVQLCEYLTLILENIFLGDSMS